MPPVIKNTWSNPPLSKPWKLLIKKFQGLEKIGGKVPNIGKMKKLLPVCLLACALFGTTSATTILAEGFEGSFPPAGWTQNSVDQSTTYEHTGSYSAKLGAAADYLITPPLTNAQTLTYWTYTTAADPDIIVETSSSTSGPWAEVTESPFSGSTAQWNERIIDLSSLSGTVYAKIRKNGTGTLYVDDVLAVDNGTTPSNTPPVLDPIGDQSLTVSNTLNFSVTASDADNDSIILSASNLPPGAVFNTITNTCSVTGQFNCASAEPVGIYTTTFYAADGSTNDSEEITTTVTNGPVVNSPPVLDPIGNQSLMLSNALNFEVTASDANNDPVILSVSNLPPGAVFNTVTNTGSVTGQFNWASAEPVGVYTTTFYAVDGSTNDFETITITVTNPPAAPPLTGAVWNVVYNLPQQSGSSYPNQFLIRDALVERIDALQTNNSAILATFTFSANDGAGFIINAMNSALNRGASISFIADNEAEVDIQYGGTNTLRELSTRTINPMTLVIDDDAGGIMHDKLGLFDYGGTNQWVFTASWNFTLAASADQWNIALEARSPSLYTIYTNEAAELLAGRFHDDPNKSHAHDGATFTLDGSWGTNFVRFAPYPDDTEGGNNAERDITNLIAQAQSEIVFALNKLNRESIRDALVDAADRGVIIKGVMPKSDTDPGGVSDDVYSYLTNSANYATTNMVQMLPAYAKADYSELDDSEPNLIHAKYMVIDPNGSNAVVIHGSANWTSEALVNDNDNDENTVFLRHNEIAAKFHEHFQRVAGTGLFDGGNSTIVEWDFNDADRIADGGLPANETQTVARIPAPGSYTFTGGNILSANGWNSGAGTKYWEASFSTEQHTDIKVSSRQTSTSTGPVHFKLQYKIGSGGTYADVTNSTLTLGTGWGAQLTRLPLPAACNNQTNVFLRWLMTSNTAVNGGSVGSSGASRIDDVLIVGTAFDLPPVVDPIDNQTVFEGELLSFTVTASDPVDGDPITLTATNLPLGSVFSNGVFNWINAAPIGAYDVTFIATDKDGSNDEVATITVLEKPLLLISEVADPAGDGGDAYRFVELYNAGTNTIDLGADGWVLSKQVNGGATWSDIELTGTIAPAATWVIANGAADFLTAYGFAPDQESSPVSGNGDDAYFLYYDGDHTSGILIDVFGEFDTDGTGTDWEYEDCRAVRNNNILVPNNVWIASEWTIDSGATTNDMTPGKHGPAPEFENLSDVFVFLGDDLNLSVTAVNSVRTDVITLSATSLPGGATFPTTIGTDTVSSTLGWIAPTAGFYTVIFDAAGDAGTTTESIMITVSSTSQIEGGFYGWRSGTIVKLLNEQFWRNTQGSGESFDPALQYPEVTITNRFGERRMIIEGVTGYKVVESIQVAESRVTNDFSGLGPGRVYQLADGTQWEQISSSDNVSSSESLVTTWRWTENDQIYLRLIGIDGHVIGTCIVEPAGIPVNPPIRSRIDGYFRGWRRDRVFALQNGEFWQQAGSGESVDALPYPNVTITNWLQTGIWRMQVEGATTPPQWVEVQRINNASKTKINGWFYGLGRNTFFHLTNGEWWLQTSPENSSSTHPYPDVLIWTEGDINYFEVPDIGLTVQARQLTVIQEGFITNTFSGLQYGNIYQTDTGESWLQVSFDREQAMLSNPTLMLWLENSQTNMLIRDSLEETIGSCTVVDPEADADGDMMSNAAEIIAGSDLENAQSIFKVTETSCDGTGRYVLHWDAVEGRVYTIEWTPSLGESFQPLETDIVWPQNSWTDTVHTVETKGFYRIDVRLAD